MAWNVCIDKKAPEWHKLKRFGSQFSCQPQKATTTGLLAVNAQGLCHDFQIPRTAQLASDGCSVSATGKSGRESGLGSLTCVSGHNVEGRFFSVHAKLQVMLSFVALIAITLIPEFGASMKSTGKITCPTLLSIFP